MQAGERKRVQVFMEHSEWEWVYILRIQIWEESMRERLHDTRQVEKGNEEWRVNWLTLKNRRITS